MKIDDAFIEAVTTRVTLAPADWGDVPAAELIGAVLAVASERAEPVAWIVPYQDAKGRDLVFTNADREVAEFFEGAVAQPLFLHPPAPAVPEGMRLDAPAQVSGARFHVGVPWATVIGAAQREYQRHNSPEQQAARDEGLRVSLADLRGMLSAQPVAASECPYCGGSGHADDVRIPEGWAVARFRDQIDAEQAAGEWIGPMVPTDASRALWTVERLSFAPHDGRALVLWHRDRPVAAALIVRDRLNWSVLMRCTPLAAQEPAR